MLTPDRRRAVEPHVSWTLQSLITNTTGSDSFGNAVAFSGNTMLVGAPAQTAGPASVEVYVRSGATWTLQARLTPPVGGAGTFFGSSVALYGDTAVIGAPHQANYAGAAYVYVRIGTTWVLQAVLRDSAPALFSDDFGFSVALYGNTALVGAAGKNNGTGTVYVYGRNGATWTPQATLTSPDAAVGDSFGFSVALQADTALVGAELKAIGGNLMQGASYVYVRSGTAWTPQARLTAADGTGVREVGYSVAVDGDTALVGAPGSDLGGGTYGAGSAYVFVRNGTTWSQQAELTAQDGGRPDEFGNSVALDGDTALVGAPYKDNWRGAAYVYVRSGTTWTLQAFLAEHPGAYGDFGGQAVAVRRDTALVGTNLNRGGAVAVYLRSGSPDVSQT
jgi:hypothetical protein